MKQVHNIAVVDLFGGDGGMPFMYTTHPPTSLNHSHLFRQQKQPDEIECTQKSFPVYATTKKETNYILSPFAKIEPLTLISMLFADGVKNQSTLL
jgi:hypothetical protein